jgi:hypothetical protein
VDPDTGQRMTRLKKDADPATVNGLVRKHADEKIRLVRDREERQILREERMEQAQMQREWHDRVQANLAAIREAAATDSGVSAEDLKALRDYHKVLMDSQPGSRDAAHLPKMDKPKAPAGVDLDAANKAAMEASKLTGVPFVPVLPPGKSYLDSDIIKNAQK